MRSSWAWVHGNLVYAKTGKPDFGQGKNDDGVGPANVRPFV